MTTAFVVKLPSGQYLADRFHQVSQSHSLAKARLFLREEQAARVVERVPGAAVTMILLAEYEPA